MSIRALAATPSRPLARRAVLMAGVAALLALVQPPAARAQAWPDKPIRMIVGYPPGGGTDTVARVLAQQLGKQLKQPVVVENRAGASGTIATQQVIRSEPDGYTVLFATASPLTGAPLTVKGLTYDPMNDLIPVSRIGGGPFILVAHPAFPPNTLPELVAYARAHPGEVNYASPGVMTANYFFSEQLNMDAGIKTVHVPYKGSAALLNDVMAGQVQYTLDTPGTTLPLIKSGKLKALAIFSEKRLDRAPDIPTAKEGGFPNMVGGSWYGLLLPKGTPPEVVDALYKATKVALSGEDVRRAMEERDVIIEGSTPDQFRTYLLAEFKRWQGVTEKLGIKPQ
ncbi:tripartite tricarboxylate transporter substrate binding protein [Achromobacter denitrificans]|uniref:Bug family tripartite tricarboxylate transporter substrate binding protein n=1 Tax=Achromobacter denitrificans TaxID=32002 RepID=UPI0023E7A7C3|nr:tripartite tricarboxylate transporter substrate binding protein [Achromobacter denitrificans]MBV2159087.1 tripartite tricarboxylate transporter substrate binding protein [Achromobacter denitrificans]MDF3857449.1 tripartite tricarboxylate transporter substrate binding protein [Achromobacter denitrificans]MDX3879657.1 tripartite tricarboxylate transporter substrate binding protein [Achromobacter sp.]WFC65070.1 tripartite tricarboxylate transporter substrate binding protein [Achromobacter denit